ncbi:MAG: hypothetical protein DRJ64_00075 [Thermoprotei archaeon]|nr:MAG: hypothetical protein DRJ64_00075 [Thermoprotei archaeon]
MSRVYLSWSKILRVVQDISHRVKDIDYIVGIKRGGVIPAVLIASSLKISDIGFVWLKRYTDDKPPKPLGDKPELLEEDIDDVTGRNILLVDDIARTGKTFKEGERILIDKGARKVVKAVIVLKENALFKPDLYGLVMKSCPIFPWEKN